MINSPDLQPAISSSNAAVSSTRKRIAEEDFTVVVSKRIRFLQTYRRQSFSLPDSIMHYIAKNPKSAKVYEKLIRLCKYFFIKNPILVFSVVAYINIPNYSIKGWKIKVNGVEKDVDMNNVTRKLWITDEFNINTYYETESKIVSLVASKIYRCDIRKLSLSDQIFSFNHLKLIASNVDCIQFKRITITHQDGSIVAFEKLVEALPKLKNIYFTDTSPASTITSATFKELVKLPNFIALNVCRLRNISDVFDLESFYAYMKKNKHIRFQLYFFNSVSEAYKTRVEEIIDEVLDTRDHDYQPPFMTFPGINRSKKNELSIVARLC